MKILFRLLVLFRPYALWMLFGALISLIATLANITLMGISGWFITAMGLAGVIGATINYFTPGAIIRACAILRTGGRYSERLVTHEATFRLIASLRSWFFKCLAPLGPDITGYIRSGDMLSRMRSDIDMLERFYLGFLVPVGVALTTSIIITIALFFYAPVLALWIGTGLLIAGGLVALLSFRISVISEKELVDNTANMRTALANDLQGIGELIIYDNKDNQVHTFAAQSNKIKTGNISLYKKGAIVNNINGLIAQITLFGAIIIAFHLLQNKTIEAANLALLSFIALVSFEALAPIPQSVQKLGGVIRAATRIFEITDQKPTLKEPEITQKPPKKFDISFENVTFSYKNDQKSVLNALSFTLKQGEKISIIGSSGAGKTSIINLLLRFYTQQSGKIIIGGNNIATYNSNELRQNFSVLEQNPYIFSASLKDNITLGNSNATQIEIEQVCEQSGLHTFIQSLPNQYDTIIGEHGRTLSGGQIKRLALARVLLKHARCIILDEPGEGLDYKMEQDILGRVMDNINKETSLIIISHRQIDTTKMDKTLDLNSYKLIS